MVCTSDDPAVRNIVEEQCRVTGARCIHALDEARVEAEPDTLGRFRMKVQFPGGTGPGPAPSIAGRTSGSQCNSCDSLVDGFANSGISY